MRRTALVGLVLCLALSTVARASSFAPAPGPWSAEPRIGNAVGHSLTFMMRVARTNRITELNMNYEGDVVLCTFRDVQSGNWMVGEHFKHLKRPIDRKHRFSVIVSGNALNTGGIPGATVPYSLRISGQFTSRHAAKGTIEFVRGCTMPKAYLPWRALG